MNGQVCGVVRMINVMPGDTVYEGHPLLFIEPGEGSGGLLVTESQIDLDEVRPDLAEVLARQTC